MDAETEEVIIERYFEENSSSYYDAFGDFFYIAIQYEDNPQIIVEQWNIRSGERNWETTVNHPDIDEVLAIEEGLLLIDSKSYQDIDNTLIFLNGSDGRNTWQKSFLKACYLYVRDMKVANSQIQILCDDILYFVAVSDGDVNDTLYLRQGSIYEYFVAEQTIFLIRETGGFRYLEGWDFELSSKLWSVQIPMDIWDFVTDGNDVIYRDGSQVYRHDGLTGDVEWQTTVEGNDPSNMLVDGRWLLAGSEVGFLHILDVKTGAVLWKQDIWATIEPRNLYVSPVALLGDEIILDVLNGFLSISGNENWIVVEPAPSPTLTPTVTPTPTPIPTFAFSADGELPEAPGEIELWPRAIVSFLNVGPSNNGRIEALLEKWTNNYRNLFNVTIIESGNQFQRVDLDGDGRQELLMALTHPTYVDGQGWILIVQEDANGQYAISWSQLGHITTLLSVTDLNNDGTIDFIAGDWWVGGPTASVALIPVGWNGQEFVELSKETITSTNIRYQNITIEDTNDDGFLEIIFLGGSFGSAGAGLTRESTFTYVWSEDGYVLESKIPVLPQDYYFFLVDANEQLVAGNYEAAIAIYESSFDTENAIYNSYIADHQRAFAEFQLMLAYLLLGDEESAAEWATSGNYPNELYTEVKQTFWDIYQQANDWTTAAEAARTQVRLAGFQANQLHPYLGYANSPLTLEDILPCAKCLQGTIGNQYGPW